MGVTNELKEAGDGVTFPKSGDKLTMHYTGTLAADGSKFDSSRDRGKPFEFTIGIGQVIKGWDEGVIKMSVGERSTLHITSDFGYGASGSPPVIPGGADLDFDVELIAINGKQRKREFYTQEEKEKFIAKMETWKGKRLAKYADDATFAEKMNGKYTDLEGFTKYLDEEIAKDVAAVKTK